MIIYSEAFSRVEQKRKMKFEKGGTFGKPEIDIDGFTIKADF